MFIQTSLTHLLYDLQEHKVLLKVQAHNYNLFDYSHYQHYHESRCSWLLHCCLKDLLLDMINMNKNRMTLHCTQILIQK